MANQSNRIKIGWAQADITPDKPVLLAGQFYARVSEGIMDPVTATALAIEGAMEGGPSQQVVMVSCDLATISDDLRDAVRERVQGVCSEIVPGNLFIGATHTHSAPDSRMAPYGMDACRAEYKDGALAPQLQSAQQVGHGMWPFLELESEFDAMPPAAYFEFAAERISEAVVHAWRNREPGGISFGTSHAVVGRNRRLTYADGTSQMYGKSAVPEFRYVEGYEDHSVQAMMTYDLNRTLTGIVVNVPCPSQVSEHIYRISADYWHETRVELRKRFGKELFVLPQCAPAGDQSPHVLIGKRAEERMWRLKGRNLDQNAPREEIAQKIADAISDIVPFAEKEIEWSPAFAHTVETLELPRRMISEKDVEDALEESRPFREEFERLMDEIGKNPAIRQQPRWYTDVTRAYRQMERGKRVQKRFELQQTHPTMPIEVHAIRLGDIAFATNPFELYLDYAVRIRELSKAVQTFLIQKSGCSGTYLPSERSVACKGYGSVPASTDIGPEGGEKLVAWTVDAMNRIYE